MLQEIAQKLMACCSSLVVERRRSWFSRRYLFIRLGKRRIFLFPPQKIKKKEKIQQQQIFYGSFVVTSET